MKTLALFLLAVSASAAPLTVEEYSTMPSITAPRFSPDGKRIVYVLTVADVTRNVYDSDLWIIDADGRNNFRLTRSPGSDYHARWSPDGSRIAFLSDRNDTRNAIFVLSAAGGEAMKLTNEPSGIRTFEWSPDGKSIAFLRMDEMPAERPDARVIGQDTRHVHLYVIDAETAEVRRITRGNFSVWDFSWSPDGKTVAFTRGPGIGLDDQFRTDIYLLDLASGETRPLVVRPGIDRGVRFSPDGRSAAFVSGGGIHDWLLEHLLHVVTIADGSVRNIGRDYGRIADSVTWSRDSKTLWFNGPLDLTNQIFRVNADGLGFTNFSKADGFVDDAAFDLASRKTAFVYESLAEPPELHVSDLTTFVPRRLTNHTAAYRGRDIGETRVVRWRNPKDGLEIEGLLTLPIGYQTGRRYPLLTFVHGGPASRFDKQFLGYLSYVYPVHVFASRGFAVFRPNPRGTGGYGEAFRAANRSDWGGMDWIDINAGIDAVLQQGIGDPDRMGMMGWSYGGFLTTWAVGHSDRFKAISIGSPVADLLSFHGTTDIRDFLPHYFPGEGGSLEEMRHAPLSLEKLRAHSPLWHVKKTPAKVMIQHVEGDERVPFSQGLMLYRLLDELGVDVSMIAYPGTGHTPQRPRQRIDSSRRNVELFTRVILSRADGEGSPTQ